VKQMKLNLIKRIISDADGSYIGSISNYKGKRRWLTELVGATVEYKNFPSYRQACAYVWNKGAM